MGREVNTYSNREIINGVTKGDSKTISALLNELTDKVKGQLIQKGLELRDVEEILLDALTVFVKKVRDGKFEDRGIPVIVFLIKVAKLRALNYISKKNPLIVVYDENLEGLIEEQQLFQNWDLIIKAMSQLSETHRKLIEFKYFLGYSDEEIHKDYLPGYSSVDSIKTQRYKAMRALKTMVRRLEDK